LKSAPARFNSYLGASRAADRAGQKDLAKDFRDRLLGMCGGTMPERLAAAAIK
jgi:hypothetical protein